MPPGRPEFRLGQPVSVSELQRVADEAHRGARAEGKGGAPQEPAGTYDAHPGARFGLWARLTASYSHPYYSFVEVYWDGNTWSDRDNGVEVNLGAREFNDAENLPEGLIVWAWLSDGSLEEGSGWVFAHPYPYSTPPGSTPPPPLALFLLSNVCPTILDVFTWDGLSGAGPPTAADIPPGRFTVWKDATSGECRLWYNDGGTMKSGPVLT